MTGSLGDLLKEISTLNTNPEIAPKIQQCSEILTKFDNFLTSTASEQSPLRQKIWEDTFKESWEDNHKNGVTKFFLPNIMISGHVEGEFIQMIAEMVKAKKIMEIGMYTGYSAVTFAQSKYCEEVVALDMEPYLEKFLKSRTAGTEIDNKIRVIIGPALESLEGLKKEGKKFDLIFLDADKKNYINYYKYIMDNDMLEEDGVILSDNILWGAGTYLQPRFQEMGRDLSDFAFFVKNDKRVRQVICPIRQGVLMIRRI